MITCIGKFWNDDSSWWMRRPFRSSKRKGVEPSRNHILADTNRGRWIKFYHSLQLYFHQSEWKCQKVSGGMKSGFYLMADGYQGYNKVKETKRCCCWAHIRRYLLEAIPKGQEKDYSNPAVRRVRYCKNGLNTNVPTKKKGLVSNRSITAASKMRNRSLSAS